MIKAIILTTQRTGSTFLADSLNSHPAIRREGELLSGGNVRVPDLVYRWRAGTKIFRFVVSGAWHPTRLMTDFFEGGGEQVRAFKAMYNHVGNPWTMKYLRQHREIHILHLRRHNVLKQYVSALLLGTKREKHWQAHATKAVRPVSTRVDPDAALAHMRRSRAQYDRFAGEFADHRVLPLVYEQLAEGNRLSDPVRDQVCDFLGVARMPMGSKLVKMNPDSLREMVENYDEVAAVISRSEFADLLD
jgi:LPS sulfotransferase NodH